MERVGGQYFFAVADLQFTCGSAFIFIQPFLASVVFDKFSRLNLSFERQILEIGKAHELL